MYQKCVRSQELTVFWHIFDGKCFLKLCHKCVGSRDLTVLWHIFMANVSSNCFRIWKEKCQKSVSWVTYDRIQTVFLWKRMLLFRHIFEFCHFSDAFPNLFWQISDRVLHLTEFWQISDTFQIVFWQFFATDRYLTVFWHISDWFLRDFCSWQFSDSFLSDIWQISKSFGTNIEQEYRKQFYLFSFSPRDGIPKRSGIRN